MHPRAPRAPSTNFLNFPRSARNEYVSSVQYDFSYSVLKIFLVGGVSLYATLDATDVGRRAFLT